MPEEKKLVPKQSSGTKTCLIIGGIFIGLPFILIVAWIILQFYLNSKPTSYQHPGSSPSAVGPLNISKSPSPNQTSNTSGNWTLNMRDTTVSISPETRIDGTDSGQVSFEMPSSGQTVTAVGDWSGQASGTSGPSTIDGTVNGKMTITAEIKNGKLHFSVTYGYDHCATTIVNQLGSSTQETCPTPLPPHSVDIDISDGATASSPITSAAVNGTENWTLNKAN